MKEGIEFAHAHDVKVYVTANILAHNGDLEGVREYFKELREIKPDALIIADPGVFQIAKEVCPEIERHVSTQANNTNYATYLFWYGSGQSVSSLQESYQSQKSKRSGNISRMILRSRHLSMAQCVFPIPDAACFPIILPGEMQIREHVHIRADGSIPSWKRPDQMNICRYMKMSVELIFFNSKDLCMIEHIPDLFDAGIDSFKIEGRMKTALYVATVARTYRKAIDDYKKSPELYQQNMHGI